MKTLSEFISEATFSRKVKMVDSEEETGAEITHHDMPMRPPHPEEKVNRIPLNKLFLHEPKEKTAVGHADEESESKVRGIMNDLKANKTVKPIKVRRKPGGNFQVIDGHHRVEAHVRMGLKHIPANIVASSRIKDVPYDYRNVK